jgi:glycosyltransferase involved in cell wall biosynthesis
MKIAVLIPTRGNRPELLENCLRMVRSQTVTPDHIELVIDTPISSKRDITWRYRIGYDRLRDKGFDVIFLMEDDDWYAPDYIETMLKEWEVAGRPDIFGTRYTIYYHLKLYKWMIMHHNTRSSAMSTLIKPDLNFSWCPDDEPYTDAHLWRTLRGTVFRPSKHICLGIKHGTTMTGGASHVDRLDRYVNDDSNKTFLSNTMDVTSFNFYTNFLKK